MKKNLILIILSALLVITLTIGTIIKKDVAFSENENRVLEQKPELSIENVLSGEYEEDSETYLSDQIFGREFWYQIMSKVSKLIGITDVNGAYFGKDGRLIQKVTTQTFKIDRFENNLKQVLKIKESLGTNVYGNEQTFTMLLVPDCEHVYYDELPYKALTFDSDSAYEMAKSYLGDSLVDVRDEFLKAKDDVNLYYFTDHHWTNEGIKIAYEKLYGKKSFNEVLLTDSFLGTLYSKVLVSDNLKDSIITNASADRTCEVTKDGQKVDSIFDKDCLDVKDKYTVFFGGNYAKVDIITYRSGIKAVSQRFPNKLLIIKDSYANSFVPYIMDDYDEITMVDTRYYKGNITDLAKEYDDILVLYNIVNFGQDKFVVN